ncbi:NUDIX domain-containing protein [Streptomyces sp. NPDC047022]|uniref:NUDIX hydrolase n=1 Tax=Streptomyces sp. NPDC047022 TaxID=3155737 RepID=UPI0033EAFF51
MKLTAYTALQGASIVVALGERGHVALLTDGDDEHLFIPGGRQEPGEDPEACARREAREEAGVAAASWTHLGTYTIAPSGTARVSLYLARGLTLGPQELTDTEADYKVQWWPLDDAITAAVEGRFHLPAGPLALLLAQRIVSQH